MSAGYSSRFIEYIEAATGTNFDVLRRTPLTELRRFLSSEYFYGGLCEKDRDSVLTSQQINSSLDAILRENAS